MKAVGHALLLDQFAIFIFFLELIRGGNDLVLERFCRDSIGLVRQVLITDEILGLLLSRGEGYQCQMRSSSLMLGRIRFARSTISMLLNDRRQRTFALVTRAASEVAS